MHVWSWERVKASLFRRRSGDGTTAGPDPANAPHSHDRPAKDKGFYCRECGVPIEPYDSYCPECWNAMRPK